MLAKCLNCTAKVYCNIRYCNRCFYNMYRCKAAARRPAPFEPMICSLYDGHKGPHIFNPHEKIESEDAI